MPEVGRPHVTMIRADSGLQRGSQSGAFFRVKTRQQVVVGQYDFHRQLCAAFFESGRFLGEFLLLLPFPVVEDTDQSSQAAYDGWQSPYPPADRD